VIKVSNLSFAFNSNSTCVEVLQDVSFVIGEGEIVAIVGPSGCGKTTLLRILAGLLTPATGSVLVEPSGASLGFVFQDHSLLPWRTVEANIWLPLEVAGSRSREEMKACAAKQAGLVGIAEFRHSFPYELSGGMRQRVALARALAGDPDMLILDEPFSALDYSTSQEMAALLLKTQGAMQRPPAIVVVTHNVADAVFLADRVIVLTPRPGRIRDAVAIPCGRPRDAGIRSTEGFKSLCNQVFSALEGLA